MASPISPSSGQPVNLHTNINRAKTKRWVEAKSYAYDGNEWGDDDEYDGYGEPAASQQMQSPHAQQHPYADQASAAQRPGELSYRRPEQYAYRVVTNPAPMHTNGEPSFGQGDVKRALSTNTMAFGELHPTTQSPPFSPEDHFPQAQHEDHRMSLQTSSPPPSNPQQGRRPWTDQEPHPHAPLMLDNTAEFYGDPRASTLPEQTAQQRRSGSGERPSQGYIDGGKDSHNRSTPPPLSPASQLPRDGSSGNPYPSGKSSPSQHVGPSGLDRLSLSQERGEEQEQPLNSPAQPKTLPFPRPADIYKRMADEKGRGFGASQIDETAAQERPTATINPVEERKSRYGFENQSDNTALPQKFLLPDDLTKTATHVESEPGKDESALMQAPSSTISHTSDRHHNHDLRDKQITQTGTVVGVAQHQSQVPNPLRHNPSAGFTSVVHQAFQDSETTVPLTPSSTGGDSIVRSTSASTSDLSPIIEGTSSPSMVRPVSCSTITPTASQNNLLQGSDPLPPPIKPGFRRDSRTPSPNNSPARRPISVASENISRGEFGIVSASTPTQSKTMRDPPSTLPRPGSPSKGTVRDLADRLESRSRASSPVQPSASVTEVPRPGNPRLESFRPSLPGGWTSYNTSTGASSPAKGPTPLQSTENLPPEPVDVPKMQDDEIPSAGPPKLLDTGFDASGKAFEALAAAGSALSGAFVAVTGLRNGDSSDNEDSTESSTRDATPVRERPGGLSPVLEVLSVASSAPPTPSAANATSAQKSSQLGYFPPPLRPTRSNDSAAPIVPQTLPPMSTDASPQDTENDRLRKEIVRSLSPLAPSVIQFRPDNEPGSDPGTSLSPASKSPEIGRTAISTFSADTSWDEPGKMKAVNAGSEPQSVQDMHERPTPMHMDTDTEKQQDVARGFGRPFLQTKFSWEASSESIGTLPKPTKILGPTESGPRASDSVESPQTVRARTHSSTSDVSLESDSSRDVPHMVQNQPKIIPVAESFETLQNDLPRHPIATSVNEAGKSIESGLKDEPPAPHPDLSDQPSPAISVRAPAQGYDANTPLGVASGRGLSFREIVGMITPQERIRAYNSARQQLASQDTGLANWLQSTGSQYPEHHDLLSRNGHLVAHQGDDIHSQKSSSSRSKFSHVGASVGNAGHQPPPEGDIASRTSFITPASSKLTSQQVQEEGKKLLQSAGKIGGKAGGAAKGLFAKGRNKFRASSGGDKVQLPDPRPSPPMTHVENVQHSSGIDTAASAPQISLVLPQPNNDTWSLSYASSENVSRTTAIDRPLHTEKPIHRPPRYPSYHEDGINSNNKSKSPQAPSPQVSAIGSISQDNIPSRTISEVTRPDKQNRNVSPTGSILQEGIRNGRGIESHEDKRSIAATNNGSATQQTYSHSPHIMTPLDDGSQSLSVPKNVMSDPPLTGSAGSSYSRSLHDTPLQAGSTETESSRRNGEPGMTSQSAGLEPRRSVVSAVSSPSPRPPSSGNATRQSISPARQDSSKGMEAPGQPQPAMSPPYEDATPPYSAALDSKEAEAAAERSLSAPEDRRQSLPAYQSPVQANAPQLPFQPSDIVPVADLSARKRQEDRRSRGRPFSFVAPRHGDLLQQHTATKESHYTSDTALSLNKELGKEIGDSGEPPYSRSYSRPFNAAGSGQHPAQVGSVENPLPSQNRNYSRRGPRPGSPPSTQSQPEEQYRIPGPYGQQFRSTRPVPMSPGAMRSPIQRPPGFGPQPRGEVTADQLPMTNRQHRSLDFSDIRPTTQYSSPAAGPPYPPEALYSISETHAAAVHSLPVRSRSNPADDDGPDSLEDYFKDDSRTERPGSMYGGNGQDLERGPSRLGSRNCNAAGSYDKLTFYQRPRVMPVQVKTKGKVQKLSKKSQRMGGANDQVQSEKKKKKGGFLRLSGLFRKSNKQNSTTPKEKSVQHSAVRHPVSNPFPPTVSGPSGSAAHQEYQHPQWNQSHSHLPSDQSTSSVQGQTAPLVGYYAPVGNAAASPIVHQPHSPPRRQPESFIGGRRLSDQRAAEQARQLENVAAITNQYQTDKHLPPPQPQIYPSLQPQSAPPTAPRFDRHPIPQPRAVSQRNAPDLRIDTSGRVNPERRSQPIAVAAVAQQEAFVRGRPPFLESSSQVIPIKSMPSPQRHSPYTDGNSQHSPYGYGSARGLRPEHLSHAIDLHKRSRSPRNGRPDSYDSEGEPINTQDPASKLGTFSEANRLRHQRGESVEDDGLQEKPWKIDLPGADDAGTTGDSAVDVGAGSSPRMAPGWVAGNQSNAIPPVELPGSKVPGDTESEEDIVMCSTAYPGQEWVPEMHAGGHWDEPDVEGMRK